MGFFLGIDLGTSYFKAGIYDDSGSLCGLGRVAVPKNTAVGRCELPVGSFKNALESCIGQAIAAAGIVAADITGVSYSSQANSFVLLDASFSPLTPLVLWPDGRAKGGCERQRRLAQHPEFLTKTGIGITPDGEWMLAKLDWFQKHDPALWARTEYVMTISDYLVYALTGRRAGDAGTASMTCLLDVCSGSWWPEALEIMSLKQEMLSEPLPIGTLAGVVNAQGASAFGLARGTRVYAGCLDHYAVAIGAGILGGSRISESTGTVLAAVGYKQGYSPRQGIITAPGLDAGHFFQLAFDGNGATAVEWYQKNYAPDKTILQLEEEARKVPAGCDGLAAKPRSDSYKGLEGFTGVKPEHTPAHFLRAIFESTAATLVGLVDLLDPDKQVTEIIPSGGGARNTLWLQIKSERLQRRYLPQASGELATKGAATICMM